MSYVLELLTTVIICLLRYVPFQGKSFHSFLLKYTAVTWETRRPSGFYVLSAFGKLTSLSALLKQQGFLTRQRKNQILLLFWFKEDWANWNWNFFVTYLHLPSKADAAVRCHTSAWPPQTKQKKNKVVLVFVLSTSKTADFSLHLWITLSASYNAVPPLLLVSYVRL